MSLGDVAPAISKLRPQIEAWVASLDPICERERGEAARWVDEPTRTWSGTVWSLTLAARPKSSSWSGGPVGSVIGGPLVQVGEQRLRDLLHQKRRQHRNVGAPLVVAIDVSTALLTPDEIATALYGPRVTTCVWDGDVIIAVETRRDRSKGFWGSSQLTV